MLTELHGTFLNTLTQPAKPMCQGTCFIVSIHDQYFMINGPICSPRSPVSRRLQFTHGVPRDDVQNAFFEKSQENPHSPDAQDGLGF